MRIFTIGFTKTSAESFFERLRRAEVSRVVDVRLNNVSQLAAFAKKDDLRYFLKSIGGIDYMHRLELAPTQEILDASRKRGADWATYERSFIALMRSRQVEQTVLPVELQDACLLCSEDRPHHCHRRLVAEYLREKWPNVEIVHL